MQHTSTSHKSLISIFEACNARISRTLVGTLYYPICNKTNQIIRKYVLCRCYKNKLKWIWPFELPHYEMNGNNMCFEKIPL